MSHGSVAKFQQHCFLVHIHVTDAHVRHAQSFLDDDEQVANSQRCKQTEVFHSRKHLRTILGLASAQQKDTLCPFAILKDHEGDRLAGGELSDMLSEIESRGCKTQNSLLIRPDRNSQRSGHGLRTLKSRQRQIPSTMKESWH